MTSPMELEERKQKEIEWAHARRTVDENAEEASRLHANRKYYSVVRRTSEFVQGWLRENCAGKDVFEMACGNGGYARYAAPVARSVVAADITPSSIEQAKEQALGDPVLEKIDYRALDCENTGLPDSSFDIVCEGGALHHMDLDAAFSEAVRLLRPGGKMFCVEALRHNPLIHTYRRLTPHLRTAWETDHILGRQDIQKGAKRFERLELKLFHVVTPLAVPLRNTALFQPVLGALEQLDRLLVKIPGFRWMAWQAVFILERPKK